jgi:hypothetical protein
VRESTGHGSHWRQAAIDSQERWGGNGDADGGSRGNAVQCLNSPAVFLAFVEIYDPSHPRRVAPTHRHIDTQPMGAARRAQMSSSTESWSELAQQGFYSGISTASRSGMHSRSMLAAGPAGRRASKAQLTRLLRCLQTVR